MSTTNNLPEIIREAAQSQLGILALLILVVGLLAYFFFRQASERIRVVIFAMIFLGAVAFGFAVVRASKTPSEASPDSHPAAAASMPTQPPSPLGEPTPVWQTQWVRTSDGQELFETFRHRTENRHGRTDIVASDVDFLAHDGRIYRVDYSCIGYACGWSYNPNGGYGPNVEIAADGRSFRWHRKWDGDPATDIYKAYYEQPQRICVANCS